MAAPGRHVGHYIHRNGRFLLYNVEQVLGHRSFGWTSALQQQATEASQESSESVVIPRKKTWSKEAVLEALALTVPRDPTAFAYQFQDDAILAPRSTHEFRMFSLAQESGRTTAKYIVNNNPKFFTKDFAEPHIPCLMPETLSLRLEEVSEEALKERIKLRKVKAAVDMYDQLLQAGTAVSMETTYNLLDLTSFYCDKEPVEDEGPQDTAIMAQFRRKTTMIPKATDTWTEDNNAERIFNLLPERDTRCYSALIRGMVKHHSYEKANRMYTDMLNNRVTGDVHIFNALISAAPDVGGHRGRWESITALLADMDKQKIRPNLLTFNALLAALRRCGGLGRIKAPLVLNEMKALGIAPSLASYNHILEIFWKADAADQIGTATLLEVLTEIEGNSFTCQDPDDVKFFCTAMKICVESKDLVLSYKVKELQEVGGNWKLVGDLFNQNLFFGRFFNLLCQMEHIDVVLKWYRRLIPAVYFPHRSGIGDLLQALDADSRLELLPTIWTDMKSLGHDRNMFLQEELLSLMARDTHSPEVQESFAVCALDIKRVIDDSFNYNHTSSTLVNITTLLLRANKTNQAWEMLELFKSEKKIPSQDLLNQFLSACHGTGAAERAVELVQLSAAFCLTTTPTLAQDILDKFDLTEDQRAFVSELKMAGVPSDQRDTTRTDMPPIE